MENHVMTADIEDIDADHRHQHHHYHHHHNHNHHNHHRQPNNNQTLINSISYNHNQHHLMQTHSINQFQSYPHNVHQNLYLQTPVPLAELIGAQVENNHDTDGIYENYNIDYDNDYEQFYDKSQSLDYHLSDRHPVMVSEIDQDIDHHRNGIINSHHHHLYHQGHNHQLIHDAHVLSHHHHSLRNNHHSHLLDGENGRFLDDDVEIDVEELDSQTDHYFYVDQEDGSGTITESFENDPNLLQQYDQSEQDLLGDTVGNYSLTFLQQQQQSLGNADGCSIYGNPLLYNLHTIYEESENESSLQTLSSLNSLTMHSGTGRNSNNHQRTTTGQQINKFKNEKNKYSENINSSEVIKTKLINNIYNSKNGKQNNELKQYGYQNMDVEIDEDDDSNEEDDYDKLKYTNEHENNGKHYLNLVDNNNSNNVQYCNETIIDDALSSKLERYFTSGLLESTNSAINNNNNNKMHQSKEIINSNCSAINDQFDQLQLLVNYLNRLSQFYEQQTIFTISDHSTKVVNLTKELNCLSYLYKIDFKTLLLIFLILIREQNLQNKLLAKNANDNIIVKINNYNTNNSLWILISQVIGHFDSKQSLSQNSTINREKLEQCLIKIMIDIYTLTQLDHLLFNHWLWQTIIIVNNPNIRQILSTAFITSKKWLCWCWWLLLFSKSSMTASLIDNNEEMPKLSNNLSKSSAKNKIGKTIIKITVNGKLLTSTEKSNTSLNEQAASITILNKTDSSTMINDNDKSSNKNPEYRTILQINNQLLESFEQCNKTKNNMANNNDDDVFEPNPITNSNSEKLTKFFRLSNPLNRSFLAKISPGTIRNHSMEHNDQLMDEITKLSNGLSSWPNDQHNDEIEYKNQCTNNEINESLIEDKFSNHNNATNHIINNGELINENSHNIVSTNLDNKINITSNGHRNSFRNFSQSTLENIYEMFRNPFKSTKKRKKSAPLAASTAVKNENNHTKDSSSKSLSEPNLSKSCKQRQNQRLLQQQKQQPQLNQNSQCSVATTKTNSQNSLVNLDPDVDYLYSDNYSDIHNSHSKSTPQLISDNKQQNGKLDLNHFNELDGKLNCEKVNTNLLPNENEDDCHILHNLFRSSWTGSWDKKLHQNSKCNIGNGINQRNSTRQSFSTGGGPRKSSMENDDNAIDSNQIKFNNALRQTQPNKSRLQRSLSGSNTSSMVYSSFQRPKSCIASSIVDIIDGDINKKNSSHNQQNLAIGQPFTRLNRSCNLSKTSSYRSTNNGNLTSNSATNIQTLYNSMYKNQPELMINHHPLFPYTPVQVQSSMTNTANGNNQFTIAPKPTKSQSQQHLQQQIIGKVCLSTYYETKLNSLTITIFRCHLNLIKKHKNDLYIKVYIMSDYQPDKTFKKKTKSRKALKVETSAGTIYELEYNEILRFNGKWREFNSGQLLVSLWNNDTFARNSLLGQAIIHLDEQVMLNSIQTRIWHDLLQQAKVKYPTIQVKGSIFLAIKCEDNSNNKNESINGISNTAAGNIINLIVLIKEADDLNLTQYNTNGYSYCKLMLKPERTKEDRYKTKMIKMGQNIRWNETFTFKNLSKNDLTVKELEIAIMCQDKSSKTYLGSIRLTNHEDAFTEERNVWKQMIDRPNLWAYGKIPLRY